MKELIARLKELEAEMEAEKRWVPHQDLWKQYQYELGNAAPQLFHYIERLEMTIEGHEQYRCDVDKCVEKQRNRIERLEAVLKDYLLYSQPFPPTDTGYEIQRKAYDTLAKLEDEG